MSYVGLILLTIVLCCFPYCNRAAATECTTTGLIEIAVEGGEHIGYFNFDPSWTDPDYWDQVFGTGELQGWYLPTGVGELFEGGIDIWAEDDQDLLMAHLDGLSVQVQADPIVTLGFSVTAGEFASAFAFSSPLQTFTPLNNTQGYAEAQIGINSGHSLFGGYPGAKAYKALYDSSTFAHLVSPITTPPWSGWESYGWVAMPDGISSMQSKFQFVLSAGGMASGTSYYEITGEPIPEPASILLLGLGGLALLRKRRN